MRTKSGLETCSADLQVGNRESSLEDFVIRSVLHYRPEVGATSFSLALTGAVLIFSHVPNEIGLEGQ
jgi:hypothetical protein